MLLLLLLGKEFVLIFRIFKVSCVIMYINVSVYFISYSITAIIIIFNSDIV